MILGLFILFILIPLICVLMIVAGVKMLLTPKWYWKLAGFILGAAGLYGLYLVYDAFKTTEGAL